MKNKMLQLYFYLLFDSRPDLRIEMISVPFRAFLFFVRPSLLLAISSGGLYALRAGGPTENFSRLTVRAIEPGGLLERCPYSRGTPSTVKPSEARRGPARPGEAWRGPVRPGEARRGLARPGEAQ